VPGPHRHRHRWGLEAVRTGEVAAGGEGAARLGARRARHLPGQRDERGGAVGGQRQPRAQQPQRVRVRRAGEDLPGVAELGQPPGVHHGDPVRDLGRDAEVVRDEQDAAPDLVAQRAEERQHLRLDGDVESGRGLVRDDQVGAAGDGHGDHHPLAQAAGELVRVARHPRGGVRDADRRHEPLGLLGAAGGLGDLAPDAHRRVERGHRVLEHRAEVQPADVPALRLLAVEHVAAADPHAAPDVRPGLEQAEHRQAQHALAGAGLAHQAEDLALADLERDPAQRVDVAAAAAERHVQVLDGGDRGRGCRGVRHHLGPDLWGAEGPEVHDAWAPSAAATDRTSSLIPCQQYLSVDRSYGSRKEIRGRGCKHPVSAEGSLPLVRSGISPPTCKMVR
jgi:hypothetical protein